MGQFSHWLSSKRKTFPHLIYSILDQSLVNSWALAANNGRARLSRIRLIPADIFGSNPISQSPLILRPFSTDITAKKNRPGKDAKRKRGDRFYPSYLCSFSYQEVFPLNPEKLVEVSESDRRVRPEGELRMWMCRSLLASVPRKQRRFDSHEILHQQISFFKLG